MLLLSQHMNGLSVEAVGRSFRGPEKSPAILKMLPHRLYTLFSFL